VLNYRSEKIIHRACFLAPILHVCPAVYESSGYSHNLFGTKGPSSDQYLGIACALEFTNKKKRRKKFLTSRLKHFNVNVGKSDVNLVKCPES
jgi:hypothetical protein